MAKASSKIQEDLSVAKPNTACCAPISDPALKSASKSKLADRINGLLEDVKRLKALVLFLCMVYMTLPRDEERTNEEMAELLEIKDAEIAALKVKEAEISAAKDAEIAALKDKEAEISSSKDAEIAVLKDKLASAKKNSMNSSKKPSGDITNPPKKAKSGEKGKPGARKGHKAHIRPAPDPSEIDHTYEYKPESDTCDCGHALVRHEERDSTLYQLELVPNPVEYNALVSQAYKCPHCGKIHKGAPPVETAAAGLVGVRLMATIFDLRCQGVSIRGIQRFLLSVLGAELSTGEISQVLTKKTPAALNKAYDELLEALPNEPKVGIDETGHKENGKKAWTWAFCAQTFVLFKIVAGRSADVIADVMKDFEGTITCDFYSAYRKWMKDNPSSRVQFCMAHLIRDIKFLADYPDNPVQLYGNNLLEIVKEMFELHHQRFDETQPPPPDLQERLEECAERFRSAALDAPDHKKAQNMAKRFREHAESYLLFVKDVFVDPTNNATEQAIRFLVILRHVTQGTRSEEGRRASERLWTIKATCAKNNVSVFDYMVEALTAHYRGLPHPSLLELKDKGKK
jgi:transposase